MSHRLSICSKLIIGLLVCTASVAFARPEKNAYLNKAATTHAQLMAQVKSDKVVLDRYMRHFAMTKAEVIQYFNTLKLSKLTKPTRLAMYNTPDSGVLRSREFVLKAGTKVWLDPTGQPILKQSCGNPLTRGPVQAVKKNPVVAGVEPTAAEEVPELSTILPEGFTDNEAALLTEALEPGLPILAAELQAPNLPEAPDTFPGAETATPGDFVTPGNSPIGFFGGLPPLFLLPALPLPFLFGGPHSGPKPPTPPPPAVPEPATVLVLGLGLLFLKRKKAA